RTSPRETLSACFPPGPARIDWRCVNLIRELSSLAIFRSDSKRRDRLVSLTGLKSRDAPKQPFGRSDDDFATMFANSSVPLPFAQNAASGVWCDIRFICQFFIGDIKFDAVRNSLPHAGCISKQDAGQSLPGSLRTQRGMSRDIPRKVIQGR